jgi:chitinase
MHLRRNIIYLSVIVAGLLTWTGEGHAAPATKTHENVFVGYLYGPSREINYRLYTHLCHAFLVADEKGVIRTPSGLQGKALTTEAHKHNVQVLISLGGWGWDKQFGSITSHPEYEERYVKSVLEFISSNDYDGIDLDWEYPDTESEIVGFERLIRRFRKELDELGTKRRKPMTLTMAASSNYGTLSWLKKDVMLETMDWINVMTYDYTGDWTNYAGHHSPLFASSKQPELRKRSVATTMEFLVKERGFPANRLAVGLPLYGHGFAVKTPYDSTKGVAKKRLPNSDYRNLSKLLNEKAWARWWDDETKTPWLLAADGSMIIGYDDAESIRIKTEWAKKGGYRGVFFWQIAGDRLPDQTNPLQEAGHRALFDPAISPKK